MKNRRGLVLISLGLILLLASLSLAGYNLWDQRRAERSAQAVMEQLEVLLPDEAEATSSAPLIPDYLLAPQMEMPTVAVEGRRYLGYLSIPALELELPVMEQWSYAGLKLSPCRYSGSAYLDDLVICAHNYQRHFGALGSLSPGEEVQFTDADGNVFHYTIMELEELPADAVADMTAGDYDLSLFTCNFSGQMRTTVRCLRQE